MPRALSRLALSLGAAALLLAGGMGAASSATSAQLTPQQRAAIVIHPRRGEPGPYARRYCRSWLVKEYRVSGTVIVPQMQCWWQ
jgi:hypothetical protein